MKKVFIIIVNWNNWPDTLECLESLKNIDYPDYRIIVVDNGSTDGSAEKIKEYIKDIVPCFRQPADFIPVRCNRGFAAGNNPGIDFALKNKADYVLLLNNDTTVDKDFLKRLAEAGEDNKKAGILGSSIYFYSQPDKIWFLGGKFNWLKTRWTKGRGHLGLDFPVNELFKEKNQKVNFITGCCMLIKREAVEKIGNLDERFFLYYEDVDYCLRARKAGFDCLVVPSAKIWHKISSSVSGLGSPKILRYHYRNVMLLTEKNAPVLIRWLRHLWAGLIASKQIFKILFFPSKREASQAIVKGIGNYYKRRFGKIEDKL